MIKNRINKHVLSFVLYLSSFFLSAQTIQQCKYRFDNYLNFKGSLNNRVQFKDNAIYILDNKGKKEFAIYAGEIDLIATFMVNNTFQKQEKLLKFKRTKQLTATQRDSILNKIIDTKKISKQDKSLPLLGYRIAIDPGSGSKPYSD